MKIQFAVFWVVTLCTDVCFTLKMESSRNSEALVSYSITAVQYCVVLGDIFLPNPYPFRFDAMSLHPILRRATYLTLCMKMLSTEVPCSGPITHLGIPEKCLNDSKHVRESNP